MDITIDSGEMMLPASSRALVERALRDAVVGLDERVRDGAITLRRPSAGRTPWRCQATIRFRSGEPTRVEAKGASAAAAALCAIRLLRDAVQGDGVDLDLRRAS